VSSAFEQGRLTSALVGRQEFPGQMTQAVTRHPHERRKGTESARPGNAGPRNMSSGILTTRLVGAILFCPLGRALSA
jgi:hypothetical protein